ncbi:carcinoembryonic antigen-related cell adhesion molecule 5-like, partial [Sigmodon hispidus]
SLSLYSPTYSQLLPHSSLQEDKASYGESSKSDISRNGFQNSSSYSPADNPDSLLASLPTCCNSLMIEPVPQNAAEGESVLLQVHNLPEDLRAFSCGRETLSTNGSLLLRHITKKDAGFYLLQTSDRDFKVEKAYLQLHVNKRLTEPFLQVTDTTVKVGSSVVFSCLSVDTDISSIQWIFNNQSLQLTERMMLSSTKCGLSIDPVRMEDAGMYKCKVFNPISSEISTTQTLALVVLHPG